MPGQINKALAKTIGSAIDPLFLPEREREGGGQEEGGGGIEKSERERKGERPHSLAFHSHGLNADN